MKNKTLRLATERRLEIIGEAARNVSRGVQDQHPEVRWQKIVALRHILAHEYGEIRREVIYGIATVHVPELVALLPPLLPPLPPPTG